MAAYDRVGNRSESTSFTILKDITPPDLILNVPADSGLILPVSWAGSDDLSGVAGYDVQVRAGDGVWTGWLTGTQRTEAEFVSSDGITYTFQVRASDRVGNTSEWTNSGPSAVQGVTKYYYFGSQRVALRRGTGSGSKVYYLHGDHLGSVSLITNQSGSTVSESRYAPFGELRWTRGASLTDFSFTGQRRDGFGLLDYHARYYSPALGRFVSADTLVPGAGNPLAWDRFAYSYNNPVNYVDLTGHNPECGPDGVWCDNNASFSDRYMISLSGFNSQEEAAIQKAVVAVAKKFSSILGINPGFAWVKVFGSMSIIQGNCDMCEPGSEVAGYTYGAHEIRFTGLSKQSELKRRNHVVHEIGHAFKWAIYGLTGVDVYAELGKWRKSHPGFPDRESFAGSIKETGPNYGFASPQNQFTWQQSLDGSNNEEFADQFLGWTFYRWEMDDSGFLTPYGQARSSMMKLNMPLWINLAAEH